MDLSFLDRLAASILEGAKGPKIDGPLTAGAHLIVDVLREARQKTVAVAFERFQAVTARLLSHLSLADRESAAYVSGVLAGMTEVLGVAFSRNQSGDFQTALDDPKYRNVIAALKINTRLRNSDIRAFTGEADETVCRKLRELEQAGVVMRQKVGREVYSRLSIAALELIDAQAPEAMAQRIPRIEFPSSRIPSLEVCAHEQAYEDAA
jgi:DNA-binding transcriptional ArsR family regulator